MTGEMIGVGLGIGTALCWCWSALAFEEAGRRAGSVPVNLLRLLVALVLVAGAGWVWRGHLWPVEATSHHWQWLLWSGFVGFFLGDVTAFRALVLIGARLTTLVMCTAPIFALGAEWAILGGSKLSVLGFVGMVVTLAGVASVVGERGRGRGTGDASRAGGPPPHSGGETPPTSAGEGGGEGSVAAAATVGRHGRGFGLGVLLAFAGAAGQGVGAVLTKRAFAEGDLDAFAAGGIRMLAGIAVFVVFVTVVRRWRDVGRTVGNKAAMGWLSLGAFGGPFLGVSLFIASVKYIPPSMTQTLTSLVPVLMIPIVVLTRGERVTWRAVAGTGVAVAGVVMMVR